MTLDDFLRTLETLIDERELADDDPGEGNFSCEGCRKCNHCRFCVGCDSCEDCTYCEESIDCTSCTQSKRCVDCEKVSYCEDCRDCRASRYLTLCVECTNCVHCLACVGLDGAEFYVLNEKRTRKEYFALLRQVQELMQQRMEAGWRPEVIGIASFVDDPALAPRDPELSAAPWLAVEPEPPSRAQVREPPPSPGSVEYPREDRGGYVEREPRARGGYEPRDRHAPNYANEPASDYADEPASDYADEPASDYADDSASDYADGSGSDYADGSGSDYADGSGSDYATGSGSDYATESGSDYATGSGSDYATGSVPGHIRRPISPAARTDANQWTDNRDPRGEAREAWDDSRARTQTHAPARRPQRGDEPDDRDQSGSAHRGGPPTPRDPPATPLTDADQDSPWLDDDPTHGEREASASRGTLRRAGRPKRPEVEPERREVTGSGSYRTGSAPPRPGESSSSSSSFPSSSSENSGISGTGSGLRLGRKPKRR